VKHQDESFARMKVTASSEEGLLRLLERLRHHGANPETVEDVAIVEADMDGALPPGFCSTTNLDTEVRIDGRWVPVAHPEMDCAIVVDGYGARTLAMSEVHRGMAIVMRGLRIRVHAPEKPRIDDTQASFGFMSSDVSSEKPKALLVQQVANQMTEIRSKGKRIMWVAGRG
jgi:hypothetical protein